MPTPGTKTLQDVGPEQQSPPTPVVKSTQTSSFAKQVAKNITFSSDKDYCCAYLLHLW